jgi:hypothetical protein
MFDRKLSIGRSRSLPSARPVAIVSVVTAPVVVAAVAVPASIATAAAVVNGNEDAGRQGQQADEGEGDQTDQTSFVLPHEWSPRRSVSASP